LKDAEEWARQLEIRADRGDLPADLQVLKATTLAEIVVRYRDNVVPKKRGAAIETIILNRFLRHSICSRRLPELRRADFASYREERLAQISPVSLRRQLGPIRHLWSVARKEWGLPLPEDPIRGLDLRVSDVRRERRLQGDELHRLRYAANQCRNKWMAPIIDLALETALRRSEVP